MYMYNYVYVCMRIHTFWPHKMLRFQVCTGIACSARVYVCMYMCMYVSMYVCMYVVHVCVRVYDHTRCLDSMSAHAYPVLHACMYASNCVRHSPFCIYVCMYVCMDGWMDEF